MVFMARSEDEVVKCIGDLCKEWDVTLRGGRTYCRIALCPVKRGSRCIAEGGPFRRSDRQ